MTQSLENPYVQGVIIASLLIIPIYFGLLYLSERFNERKDVVKIRKNKRNRTFTTMTQEQKDLLLKDFCARLPYKTEVECSIDSGTAMDVVLQPSHITEFIEGTIIIKPYLRSMSSMTDEEIDAMWDIYENDAAAEGSSRITDLLNERHLDHHHLIEQGLAIKVTKKNNPYERI